jgi:alpha-galactosidase
VRNQFARSSRLPGRASAFRVIILSYLTRTLREHAIETSKPNLDTAIAAHLLREPARDSFPLPSDWDAASPVRFDSDWQGQNPDPQRSTEVRLLWTPGALFLKFHARFRTITVFPDSDATGRRDQLWDRDVAEVFLQPDPSQPSLYKEFEVSPNGMWIDLDIAPGAKSNPNSGLRRRVTLDQAAMTWIAELAIPMASLTRPFDPFATWRANFFRVEGAAEPRFYSAWRPTKTPVPNFHVPAAFGSLIFSPAG